MSFPFLQLLVIVSIWRVTFSRSVGDESTGPTEPTQHHTEPRRTPPNQPRTPPNQPRTPPNQRDSTEPTQHSTGSTQHSTEPRRTPPNQPRTPPNQLRTPPNQRDSTEPTQHSTESTQHSTEPRRTPPNQPRTPPNQQTPPNQPGTPPNQRDSTKDSNKSTEDSAEPRGTPPNQLRTPPNQRDPTEPTEDSSEPTNGPTKPTEDSTEPRNFDPVCYQTTTVDFVLAPCKLLGIIRIQDIDGYYVTVTSTGLPDGAVYILPNGNTISDTSSPLTLALSRDEPGREGIGIVDLGIKSYNAPGCAAQFTVMDGDGDFTTCDYDCTWTETADCGTCTLIGGPCEHPVTRDCICNWIDPVNGDTIEDHCCPANGDTVDVWDDICAKRAVCCGCERKEHRRTPDISACCFEWSGSCSSECKNDFYDECWANEAFCSSETKKSLECRLCCRTNAISQELWKCPFEECQMFPGLPCTHRRCHFPQDLDDAYFLDEQLQVCDLLDCCKQSSRGHRRVWMFEPNSGRCGLFNFTDITYIEQDSEAASDWWWGFPQDGDAIGVPGDNCPNDPRKYFSGVCGCGVVDSDNDRDGAVDCLEPPACRSNPVAFEEPCVAICEDAVIPRSAPGTSNSAVEDCVCGIDPICCLLSWDQTCVGIAQTDCGCTI